MRLLIVGTGGMAKNQAEQFSRMENVEIVGAVDTDAMRLANFADQFNIPQRFTTLDEAIAWVKRCPNPMPGPSEIEIRPLFCVDELADSMTFR